jgi:hypothetical protein
MWILVVVQLVWGSSSTPMVNSEVYGKYYSMEQCLQKREFVVGKIGRVNGFPKPNNQVVCIRAQRK